MSEEAARSCARCGRDLPSGDFDRRRLGAYTDGGMATWCNDCYAAPYRSELGTLEKRPMRHVSEVAAVKPWTGHRARKAGGE